MKRYRLRRMLLVIFLLIATALPLSQSDIDVGFFTAEVEPKTKKSFKALEQVKQLSVKGRSPKTGYSRAQFGDGWGNMYGCDTRNRILARDLDSVSIGIDCKVYSGILHDPYTGKTISFVRGAESSDDVQIDHVVALSNSWQTGAQLLSYQERVQLANFPQILLVVDGEANQEKSDGDAATWLPPNKPFRCQYVERQIKVKAKYRLWLTLPEAEAIKRELTKC